MFKKKNMFFWTLAAFSSVQLLSRAWTAAHQACLSITNSRSLLKLMSIELLMPSNHLILCHPLLLLPSIFPSIRVFSRESVLHIRWPKYWSFSFSISSSNEYSGLISFRIDWLDLLAVQGTLKSLLQHHSSKVSILWHSAFFIVQLSHPYMTIGKTKGLTRWTFAGKVMSLLFNMLSKLVIPLAALTLLKWLSWDGHLSRNPSNYPVERASYVNSTAPLTWNNFNKHPAFWKEGCDLVRKKLWQL